MKRALPFMGLALCAGSALAAQPVAAMSFVSIPSVEQAIPVGAQLLQFRSGDQTLVISAGPPEVLQSGHQGEMPVIARQWAPCGQRPTAPSFDLGSGTLNVSYGLTGGESTSVGQGCVATGILTVKGLPDETLEVATDNRPVPAIAQASPPGPSMTFLSVPAIEQPKTIQPMLLQYRHGRELIAVVTQRSECGQRPTEPSFEIAGGIANVGYRVPAGDSCMATGIFELKNLPERNLILSVYVNGGQAQLLCEGYGDPTTNC